MDAAMTWAVMNPLELEAAYPYTSGTTGKDGTCNYVKSMGKSVVKSHTNVRSDSQA